MSFLETIEDYNADNASQTQTHSHRRLSIKERLHKAKSVPGALDDKSTDLPQNAPKCIKSASSDRLKRDYKLSSNEIKAMKVILRKVNLYDENVREKLAPLLHDDLDDAEEAAVDDVIHDKEIECWKQKLFMSRKELDSYISFTKKMEREKRQILSEKEELETKLQWHEKRLDRFESENKSLKVERAELTNQIYELRGKSSVQSAASDHVRKKWLNTAAAIRKQNPELEQSKQRLIYEADAFAQERAKLIKERQRLDEEVRKVQIRCVSLLAQLQHSEKTIKEVQGEKDQLRQKVSKLTKLLQDEGKLKDERTNVSIDDVAKTLETNKEFSDLERKYEQLQKSYNTTTESNIKLEHEIIALNDTINVLRNAKDEAEVRASEVDIKYRDSLSEMKTLTEITEKCENEQNRIYRELDDLSSCLADMQRNAVNMEADQDAFKKFLDKLSMELQEKLGEEHVSKDTDAESLQEQAEVIGRQVVAHLNPPRKLQKDFEDIKQEKEELEEEIQYLKYALSGRVEIKTIQQSQCHCSKEKEHLKIDLDESVKRIEKLENEVSRLHQDKQSLLMSFLNLQAAQRSRGQSKSSEFCSPDEEFSGGEFNDDGEYNTRTGSYISVLSSYNPSLDSSDKVAQKAFNSVNSTEVAKLLEVQKKINQKLESEKVGILESLYKHVEENKLLKQEIEHMRADNISQFFKEEKQGTSERCPNCRNVSKEVRNYLRIIEELTEDKLRLEKSLDDAKNDAKKYQKDFERMTDDRAKMVQDLQVFDTEKEHSIQAAKEENKFLLANIQTLEQENTILEENLQKLREDKAEILENLRQGEEDRFGFIRTIGLITEQKEIVENELQDAMQEIKFLKDQLT